MEFVYMILTFILVKLLKKDIENLNKQLDDVSQKLDQISSPLTKVSDISSKILSYRKWFLGKQQLIVYNLYKIVKK